MKMLALGLLAAMTIATPAFAAELVVNGGFDDDAVPSGGFIIYDAGQTIGGGGWTVLGNGGNSGLNLSTGYTEFAVSFVSQAGPNSFDLTASGNTGPASGIYQDIATIAGQQYQLSFWLGNADGSSNGSYTQPSALTLTIGNGPSTLFSNADTTFESINWQQNSVFFTATDATTRIQFNNATVGDNFAGLDSVSVMAVTAVPEPAAWALMIGGFGLVGGMLRRREAALRFA